MSAQIKLMLLIMNDEITGNECKSLRLSGGNELHLTKMKEASVFLLQSSAELCPCSQQMGAATCCKEYA